MSEKLSIQEAVYRIEMLGVGAVRSREESWILCGPFQSIISSEHDIHFTCVDGPDCIAHSVRLSVCEVAPIVLGKIAWDQSFTIPSLLDEMNFDELIK